MQIRAGNASGDIEGVVSAIRLEVGISESVAQ